MIPIKDRNPTRRFAWITFAIIVGCVAVYFFVEPTGRATLVQRTDTEQVDDVVWTIRHAAIPCELVRHRHITVPEVVETFRDHVATCDTRPLGPPADPGKNIYLAVLYSMFLCCTWAGTCCSCGSSGTTSRTGWGGSAISCSTSPAAWWRRPRT
jgi:hypothetical protein